MSTSATPDHFAPSPQPNPARLTTTGAIKLPRWVLLGLCFVYIVTGLVLREPWKSEDVVGLAQMASAVYGGWPQWLTPEAAGIAASQEGPLMTWAGAISMELFSGVIGPVQAGRLPNLLWFGIATASLWYGTYLLGRRLEAQPLALPFGGQPDARDYGRMLADAALLLLMATLGVLWRTHETSAEPAALAFQALAFYALARMLDHRRSGAVVLGLALGGAFLARGFPALLPPLLAVLALAAASRPLRPALPWMLACSLPLALCLGLAWWIPATLRNPYWMNGWWAWQIDVLGWITPGGMSSALRNMPWFMWPTGPLAVLALWRWRGHLASPHIHIPLALAAAALLMLVFTRNPVDAEYLSMVTPAATLSALALPTLRRGLVNALDWFAVMVFSATASVVWMGWIAMMTGVPPKIARNIARQTPGFVVEFSAFAFSVAVLATAAWIAVVVWRLRAHPTGLWRGSVMSAAGVAVTWLLLMTLWLPSINYNKSYRDVSGRLAAAVATENLAAGDIKCMRSSGLGLPQRASFYVFDGLRFEFAADCPLVLLQGNAAMLWKTVRQGDYAGARIVWEGSRASETRLQPERREYFILLRP